MIRTAAIATAAVLLPAAPAAAAVWKRIAVTTDESSFYASASLSKRVKSPVGLKLRVAATATAKMTGTVSCVRTSDFDYGSYNFAYSQRTGDHLLRVPMKRADCTVFASATLAKGGRVQLALYRR